MTYDNLQWVSNNQPLDFTNFCDEDNVKMMPKLGTVKALKLKELGISKVVNLKNLLSESIADLKGIRIHFLADLLNSTDSNPPRSSLFITLNYRKKPNPYLVKHGPGWEKIVRKTVALRVSTP